MVTYTFEWLATHSIQINPGDFCESLLLNEQTLTGRDEYHLSGVLLPGKRLAGLGRFKVYSLNNGYGFIPFEADPSTNFEFKNTKPQKLSFNLTTNIILDQGQLAQNISLLIKDSLGQESEIPLSRPDICIDWISRGNYIINIPLNIN